MNKKTIFLFITMFFLFFSMSFLLKQKNISIKKTNKKNVEELIGPSFQDVYLEKIKLNNDNESYTLKNEKIVNLKGEEVEEKNKINKILSLALFYQWNKEDPLFTSPDFDWVGFEKSLNILNQEEAKLLGLIDLKKSVFPKSFLFEIKNVSLYQDTFMGNPSETNADALLGALEKAVDAYHSNILSLEDSIKNIDNNQNFIFLADGLTNKKIILSDIAKIANNVIFLKKEIKNRKSCFSGDINHCLRPGLFFEKPEFKIYKDLSEESFAENIKFLEKEKLFHVEGYKKNQLRGPYEIETRCIQEINPFFGDKQYLYAVTTYDNILGTNDLLFKSATTNYYSKYLPPIIEKKLKYKKTEWKPIPETNPYTCTNFEYLTQIATTDKFFVELKDNRLYSNVKNNIDFNSFSKDFKDLINEGQRIEDTFFNKNYPSFKDLELLSRFYGHTYTFISRENISVDKEEFLRRYLIIDRKFSNFDSLFNNFILLYLNVLKRYYLEESAVSYNYIFLLRSAYSLTYFPFSSSVWRSQEKLKYFDIFKKENNERYINYQEAVLEYGEDEVLRWNENNNMPQIYNELFVEKFNSKNRI
jgi:hypothetical protein